MLASMARSPIAVNIPITKSLSSSLPVAIAKDAAFSFIYEDTLDRLERLGVRWVPFSPLRDRLPLDVAGVYLPGGYPELHAEELSRNGSLFADLRYAHSIGMPIFAECGGYMSMAEAMIGINGCTYPMANIIPGRSRMTNRLQSFGYKRLIAAQNTLLCPKEAIGKAHEFHYSIWEGIPNSPAWLSTGTNGNDAWQGHVDGNLLASYVHLHFGAMPNWANTWVTKMRRWFTARR
jgi:cobyrinic acid a,c-diamide synthase